MASTLDELIAKLEAMPAKERRALEAEVRKASRDLVWVPNLGPQADAFDCEADELLFGGSAGGGKSDLLLGLALTRHRRSAIYRRRYTDILRLIERTGQIVGNTDGLNKQEKVWRLGGGKLIEFGAMEHETDREAWKGRDHDLKAWDELSDFTESQYTFVNGWNRTEAEGQRCRIVAASNPPTTVDGLWIVRRWGAWLDPAHPRPAKSGELRWFTSIKGVDTEVDGPGPVRDPETGEVMVSPVTGRPILPRSRTFIRSTLADNPDYMRSGYEATVAGLPEPYRTAYMEGRFDVSLRDDERQLIPTAWIVEAQARWTAAQPKDVPMTSIGCDPNGGGRDRCILSPRWGSWFAPLVEVRDVRVDDATAIAAEVFKVLRNGAPIVMDMGGGYGGGPAALLRNNGMTVKRFNGADGSTARTRDAASLAFRNKRAEAWWRFREALDPSRDGGSVVMLPPDDELRADLAAQRFTIGPGGILLDDKDDVRERIGRSPDKGDAVVMAWTQGDRLSPAGIVARDRDLGIVHGRAARAEVAYAHLKRRA